MKKILHITNDYAGSTVYKNLIRALDKQGAQQIVYTPVKKKTDIGENKLDLKTPGSKLIYSHILNKTFDRVFYRFKIHKIYRDLNSKVDLSQIDFIHAHTWYSDGGVACLIQKKYGTRYIITVRNSDINAFQKYLIHERPFGRKIIEKAKAVIVISASYKRKVQLQRSLQSIQKGLKAKLRVIPNGVDPYWIKNVRHKESCKTGSTSTFNILFIGKFTTGKNILALQEAILQLNQNRETIAKLHFVGGGGKATQEVEQKIEAHPDVFRYYGKVYDKDKLSQIIRKCDIFAMPSRHETFGLVYVEAMLQGLPILYTEGEGIDGFYSESIGEKVQDFTSEEIAGKLNEMIVNYDKYYIPIEKIKIKHNWSLIAEDYKRLYKKLS